MPKLVCNECEEELDYERNKHLYTCPECREGQLEKVREAEGTEMDANVGGEDDQPDVVQMLDRKTMCCGKRMTYDYTEVGCDIDREWSRRTGRPVSIPRGYTCVASLRCTECCTEVCIEIRGKERSQKASEWIKEEIIDA